jgi:hypothetical protein
MGFVTSIIKYLSFVARLEDKVKGLEAKCSEVEAENRALKQRLGNSVVDKKLFDEFLKLLPTDGGTVRFFKEHDIAVPFPQEILRPPYILMEIWKDNAEKEFLDPELEEIRMKLINKVIDFHSLLAQETTGHRREGWLTIEFKDWSNPPELVKFRSDINELGHRVFGIHQELVAACRRKL